MSLAGKRAIVTGSSSGIGRAIAILLAAEGAQVVVNARGSGPNGVAAINAVVDEITGSGGKAIAFAGAVDAPDVAKAMVARCVDAFGGVDILVNNAGIFGASAPVDQCPLDEWRAVMRVNLDGVFFMCREALPHMKAQRWGRIITAGSLAGYGQIGGSGYSASKSALYGLMRSIAADYGPYGVTANCYNPEARGVMGGSADQTVFDGYVRHYKEKGFYTAAEAAYLAGIGGPDGVAPWIAYLCSDQADYLNGQTFALDTRRVALVAPPDEVRMLFRDAATQGPWSINELERLAPLVFPLVNEWPRREGQALADWEAA